MMLMNSLAGYWRKNLHLLLLHLVQEVEVVHVEVRLILYAEEKLLLGGVQVLGRRLAVVRLPLGLRLWVMLGAILLARAFFRGAAKAHQQF